MSLSKPGNSIHSFASLTLVKHACRTITDGTGIRGVEELALVTAVLRPTHLCNSLNSHITSLIGKLRTICSMTETIAMNRRPQICQQKSKHILSQLLKTRSGTLVYDSNIPDDAQDSKESQNIVLRWQQMENYGNCKPFYWRQQTNITKIKKVFVLRVNCSTRRRPSNGRLTYKWFCCWGNNLQSSRLCHPSKTKRPILRHWDLKLDITQSALSSKRWIDDHMDVCKRHHHEQQTSNPPHQFSEYS